MSSTRTHSTGALLVANWVLDSRSALGDDLVEDVGAGEGGLSGVQGVDLGEELEASESRLCVGIDQIARVQFDLNVILPGKGMIFVADVARRGVELCGQILDVLERDLHLLGFAAHHDPLQWPLAVQQGDRRMRLREQIQHLLSRREKE